MILTAFQYANYEQQGTCTSIRCLQIHDINYFNYLKKKEETL